MPRIIVQHDGWYFIWSTVVDAPVTAALTRSEMEEEIRNQAANGRLHSETDARVSLARAEEHGTSAWPHYSSARDLVAVNRAGPGETDIPFDEVIALVHRERG